jgi:hypothetical protein
MLFVHAWCCAGEPDLTDEDKRAMREIVRASVEGDCTRVGVAVGKAAVRACMHSSTFVHVASLHLCGCSFCLFHAMFASQCAGGRDGPHVPTHGDKVTQSGRRMGTFSGHITVSN